MLDCEVKYSDEIPKLRSEGKTYREISEILDCSMSMVSYHLTYKYKLKEKRKNQAFKRKEKEYRDKTKHRWKNIKKENKRDYVIAYLKSHPCVDCGFSDIRALEFDHIKGKKLESISWMIRDNWSIEELKDEIEKCEVRCANCHRIITKERLEEKRLNKINNN